MSFPLKSSKRPYDRSPAEPNGKGKWQKTSGFNPQLQPLKISPGSTVFRILCPLSKSGSVIGKGGSIINRIRQETGVKVRVEEAISRDDERVIVIVGSEKEVEGRNEENKEDGKDDNTLKADGPEEEEEENDDKVSSPTADSETEKGLSAAQKALFLVFERIVDGESEYKEEVEESKRPASVVLRLLVLSSQVGFVRGKGGKMIKQMAAESGAQIQILPRDKLPKCASTLDDLVQLTGGFEAVKKGLHLISQQLVNNPPREVLPTTPAVGPSSNHSLPLSKPLIHQSPNYQFLSQAALYSSPPDRADYHLNGPQSILNHRETVVPGRMRPSLEINFRLLCHNENVRGIIGKGGSIVNMIHRETGCEVRVLDGPIGSEDSVIVVSGPVHPDDRISAVQDAVLRVQGRILAASPENSEKVARFLVSINQIGCLLGKGGSVMAEMRRLSGAYIHIVPRDQMSKFMPETEEVVQITGGFETVEAAILQITSRLRHHLIFGDTFPSVSHPSHPAFRDQVPPFPYMGRRESSPPGLYTSPGGLPPLGRVHPHDDRPGFSRSLPGQDIHYGSGRTPSSVPWGGPQGLSDVGGPMGMPDYAQRRNGGFGSGSGSQAAIITNTTVEVVVPRAIVPSIYGEEGSSLKQIRQISGANITITEPKPGATETIIIISGTPEQTHAAQSLLQAFVLSGTDSP